MARKIRRDNLRSHWLHRLLDIALNWLAISLAYAAKERFNIGIPTEPITREIVLHTLAAVAVIWIGVTSALDVYRYKRRLFQEVAVLAGALLVAIAFLNTYIFFARPFIDFVYPRWVMILYGVFGVALLAGSRTLKHAIRRSLHCRGIATRRVVIVGTSGAAHRLARAFREDAALGYRFMGFVTEPRDQKPDDDHLGTLDRLTDLIHEHEVDEVIVTLPGQRHQQILDIAHQCQEEAIRLRVVPDLFDVIMVRATLTEIDDIPLIGLRDPVITGYQSVIKRVFDLIFATLGILLTLPVMVLIAVTIRLDSRGPIIFRQIRVGENGRRFAMYKFRSMVPDAEQRLGDLVNLDDLPEPVFKIPDDPRVTRVGRFLRRTSLDELPQLFNVIKGEMSMVGPRPEELQVVQHYQLWHRRRLSVKPGITGPMQVAGRGELSLDERIKLELMYISRYSILEDIKYLLRTLPAVCRARGAY